MWQRPNMYCYLTNNSVQSFSFLSTESEVILSCTQIQFSHSRRLYCQGIDWILLKQSPIYWNLLKQFPFGSILRKRHQGLHQAWVNLLFELL